MSEERWQETSKTKQRKPSSASDVLAEAELPIAPYTASTQTLPIPALCTGSTAVWWTTRNPVPSEGQRLRSKLVQCSVHAHLRPLPCHPRLGIICAPQPAPPHPDTDGHRKPLTALGVRSPEGCAGSGSASPALLACNAVALQQL